MKSPPPESLFADARPQHMHAPCCHVRGLTRQDAWLWTQLGKLPGRERWRPAARGRLCLRRARDSGAKGDPPLAYPGSQGAPPSTLASRGEAALYRRASQEQPRYTSHDQAARGAADAAGRQPQGGSGPAAARSWGLVSSPTTAPQPTASPQSGDRRHATVHFCCRYRAVYGQRLRIVGSHANLGSWVLSDGPEMAWTHGDLWRADVALPAGGVYEYKYVLVGSGAGGRHALAWQRGNNSVLALSANESEAEVMDNWEGAPGAVVVVGGRAATREGQLLAWANDMETTIATQRSELRAARMELAAMQEELAQARQARAELARLQDLRRQEAAALSEAQASNQLLRTQLVEATSAFHHALSIAQTLLTEAEELTGLAEEGGEGEDAWYEDDPEEISEQEAVELSLHVTASAAEISEDSAAAVGAAPPART